MNSFERSETLKTEFNKASDNTIAFNEVWQAFNENPSVILSINH